MATTIALADVVRSARAYPELNPILGTSGFTSEPAVTIGNDVMQRILAQGMDWKFNRQFVKPFLTNALQQDYIITAPLDLAWIEQGVRVDINNSVTPKPVFGLEAQRDLGRTSYQANPFHIGWIPVSQCTFGSWVASTSYPTGLGAPQTPQTPIQQFIDSNGNFLVVTSYGTSGTVQPVLPAKSPAGTTIVDNGVTWTVVDPDAVAIRVSPLPATSGIVWQVYAVYQKKPPIFKTLQDLITPIPDEYSYLFRQGFMAFAYMHAGSRGAEKSYAMWEEALMTALRAADREREGATFYPSESLIGGGPYKYGMPVGPAWPFDYWGQ